MIPTLILSSHLSLGVQAVSFTVYKQKPLWILRTSLRATWPSKLILIHVPASITNDRHYANFSKLLLTVFSSARCSPTTAAFTLLSTKGHTENKRHNYCFGCSNLDVSTQHTARLSTERSHFQNFICSGFLHEWTFSLHFVDRASCYDSW